MAQPYMAIERFYLTEDKQHTRGPVYHPAIKMPGDKVFTYFPDEATESGLVEHDNPEDALQNAIMLYKHYVGDEKPDISGYYLLSLKNLRSTNNFIWWKPNSQGYTDDLNQAGVYTAEEIETTNADGVPVIKRQYCNSDTVAVAISDVERLVTRKCILNTSNNLIELGVHISTLPEY